MPEALSLRDTLDAGIPDDEDVSDVEAVETTEVVEQEAPETEIKEPETQTEPRARDATGKFVKQEVAAADTALQTKAEIEGADTQAAVTTAQEGQAGVDLPPSTFTPAAKAAYAALPPDSPLRADIKKREADFQKGIGQYKQQADFGTKITETIRPYEGLIRASGSTPEAAIAEVMRTNALLRTGTPQEKGQLLMRAAKEFGADLSPFMGQQQAQQDGSQGFDPNAIRPMIDQLLQPHLQKFSQFESQFMTAQQQREQAEIQSVNASIDEFRQATDEKGQPKHIYFDDVRGMMAAFLESGNAQTMDQAYEMACRAHPEVSTQVTAAQRAAEEAKRLVEAKQKANLASKANAVNATGQGGVGIADTTKSTLRSSLESGYDAMVGARV